MYFCLFSVPLYEYYFLSIHVFYFAIERKYSLSTSNCLLLKEIILEWMGLSKIIENIVFLFVFFWMGLKMFHNPIWFLFHKSVDNFCGDRKGGSDHESLCFGNLYGYRTPRCSYNLKMGEFCHALHRMVFKREIKGFFGKIFFSHRLLIRNMDNSLYFFLTNHTACLYSVSWKQSLVHFSYSWSFHFWGFFEFRWI